MTREDLVAWLEVNDCFPDPIEGVNVTGWSVRFINKKSNRYTYVKTPIDETVIPDYMICHICDQLLIPHPDCVADQAPLMKHLKERFGKKENRN
jgi:hypothetical protein